MKVYESEVRKHISWTKIIRYKINTTYNKLQYINFVQ